MKSDKQWVCYLIKCVDDSFYCGITNNIDKRLIKHSNGTASKYTRCRRPIKLLIFVNCKDKSNALKLEYKVKQLKRENKYKFLLELNNGHNCYNT